MKTGQAAEILLVRAVEEDDGVAPAPDAAMQALEAAGDFDDERSWFARRARFLLGGPYAAHHPLLGLHAVFAPGFALNFGLPFVAGLLANYLGPQGRIHVLYNPIAFLLVWNLLAYAAMAAQRLLAWRDEARGGRARAPEPIADTANAAAPAVDDAEAEAVRPGRATPRRLPLGPLSWLLRRSAAKLWLRAHRATAHSREEARTFSSVGRRFFTLWDQAARVVYVTSARRILHLAAIGVAVGAVAGMYVRGLFLEYDMVWRSTFVHAPESVATLMGLLLGPAALLLEGALPSAADARALMTPEGSGAARWIGLYAVATGLWVVLPRAVLWALATRRLARLGNALDLDFGAPYFEEILAEAREIQVGRVHEEIQTEVRIECGKFAEGVGVFVTDRLFDGRIAPRLRRFRAEGGSVAGLEEDVRGECEAFGDELQAFLARARKEFEESLSRAILAKIGRSLSLPAASGERLGAAVGELPEGSVGQVGQSLSQELVRPVSAGVTAAVATLAGTVSGGFGESLGVAILTALLGTTGPIGFVLGAVAGVVAAGAALWLGRERLREGVKKLRLPGWVAKGALPAKKLDRLLAEGRDRCQRSVRELMHQTLEPVTEELAEQIWTRVRPMLAPARAGGPGAPEESGAP